ncbi:unnamed protein product [Anisakis simplex]|uniref:Protein kinase domain-containing protein n=1 Tax=Anisakis simplex TaxID=6269 RepID=A0A0M3J2P4_ANISI|nr:unnamed protein product [Anisakis simplex]
MDSLVEDAGDFYDGENESDDKRNEHSFKRSATTSETSADGNEAKKPKIEQKTEAKTEFIESFSNKSLRYYDFMHLGGPEVEAQKIGSGIGFLLGIEFLTTERGR